MALAVTDYTVYVNNDNDLYSVFAVENDGLWEYTLDILLGGEILCYKVGSTNLRGEHLADREQVTEPDRTALTALLDAAESGSADSMRDQSYFNTIDSYLLVVNDKVVGAAVAAVRGDQE